MFDQPSSSVIRSVRPVVRSKTVLFGVVISSLKLCSGSTTVSSMIGMVREGGIENCSPAGKTKLYFCSAM